MGLKILFLSHFFYPDIGGIETNSEILAQAFSDEGHDVHLLTWSPDEKNKHFPYRVIRNPGLAQLFAEHKWADVVFENNPCLRLAWQGLFFGRPSVIALNTWISQPDGSIGLQERLKFKWLKRAKKVIAVSNAVRLKCWPKAIVITNPFREKEFRKISGVRRVNDFVFLGRLVSDKGADLAIGALSMLSSAAFRDTNKNMSLTIIGDGPDRQKLEQLTDELSIKEQVHFAGLLRGEELVTRLNSHRYMLVPSVWEEPFGNVVLEGMACGCLPIVSDGGGLPDAAGDAGLLFKRGDVNALTACITYLLAHPELEQKILNAAGNHLAAHHSKNVAKRYLEVIESAVDNRKK